MTKLQKIVNDLLKKAVSAKDPDVALRFSQAALNAANTNHIKE